jgi:hypothetical protein
MLNTMCFTNFGSMAARYVMPVQKYRGNCSRRMFPHQRSESNPSAIATSGAADTRWHVPQ